MHLPETGRRCSGASWPKPAERSVGAWRLIEGRARRAMLPAHALAFHCTRARRLSSPAPRGALLLSGTKASVAEFRRQTLARDDDRRTWSRRARRNDSYAGVMDTARAARDRSSRVGGRAETRPKPRGASRKGRQERRWRHVRPGFLSDHRRVASARDHGGEAEFAASDSYRGRHDNHAWCRKFESALHHRKENPAAMRDLGTSNGETRTRTGDTTIFSRGPKSL